MKGKYINSFYTYNNNNSHKLILLIEDDPEVQDAISLGLGFKYKVLCADNADDALKILNKTKIDLILMDINIKGDTNSLQLTSQLKYSKDFAEIPAIAVTALNTEKDRLNCLTAGCNDYISKPYDLDDLLQKISNLIG